MLTFKKFLALSESLENKWIWSAWEEVKNHGGDGPDAEDRHREGMIEASSKEEAIEKAEKKNPKCYDFSARPATQSDMDHYYGD